MVGKIKLYGFTVDRKEYDDTDIKISSTYVYKTNDEYIFLYESKDVRDSQFDVVDNRGVSSLKKINKPVKIRERYLRFEDV